MSADADDPRIGTVLQDRYRIVELLAQGGMGVVYRGERLQLNRSVAIKFLHSWATKTPDAIKRFEIEAQAMSRLSSPACVSVIDFGTDDGAPYLVMDFVAGDTLRDLMDGPMPVRRALTILRQILAGLAHAHGHGITHRDIKPENIVLTENAGFDAQVRILDFGVAKLANNPSQLTAGFAVGTPSYMAPEQSTGQPIDARTDLYAAGVLLFELLTGERPFKADSAIMMIRAHCEDPPPRMADVAPALAFSPELEAVVARALAKKPADRFQSAADMATALESTPEWSQRSPSLAPTPTQVPSAPSSSEIVPLPVPLPVPVSQPTPPSPTPAAASSAQYLRVPQLTAMAKPHRRPDKKLLLAGAAAGALAIIIVLAIVLSGSNDAKKPDTTADEELELPIIHDPEPDPATKNPELEAILALARRGDTSAAAAKLKKLRKEHPDDRELAYHMGNLHCRRSMWVDCFDAYRDALPDYREDATLIKLAIRSFNSDRHHGKGMAFVERDIGAPAIPHLEATAADDRTPGHIKKRAAAVLERLR